MKNIISLCMLSLLLVSGALAEQKLVENCPISNRKLDDARGMIAIYVIGLDVKLKKLTEMYAEYIKDCAEEVKRNDEAKKALEESSPKEKKPTFY